MKPSLTTQALCLAVAATIATVQVGCGRRLELSTPVPQTIHVDTPGSDVPASIAAFSGVWNGDWDAPNASAPRVQHTLVVQRILPLSADHFYVYLLSSWGRGAHGAPDYAVVAGTIGADGALRIDTVDGRSTVYTMAADRQSISAEFTRPGAGTLQHGVLRRLEPFPVK